MLNVNNPYTLRIEETEGTTHYFVLFKDGQAVTHEIEITATLYKAFDDFRKEEKRQQNAFERHIEHSELEDGALYGRAFRKPESLENMIIQRERMIAYRRAVAELPDIQRRRFVLYYEHGLTFRAIGILENCTATQVKTVDGYIKSLEDGGKAFEAMLKNDISSLQGKLNEKDESLFRYHQEVRRLQDALRKQQRLLERIPPEILEQLKIKKERGGR